MANRKRPAKKLELWHVDFAKNATKWAEQLGVYLDEIPDGADLNSGANRMRLREGGAPKVAKRIYDWLVAKEKGRSVPTEMGRLMMGVDEWAKIGRAIAQLDPAQFLLLLEANRGTLRSIEHQKGSSEVDEPKTARAFSSANIIAPPPSSPDSTKPAARSRKR